MGKNNRLTWGIATFVMAFCSLDSISAMGSEGAPGTQRNLTVEIPAQSLVVPVRVSLPTDYQVPNGACCVVESLIPETKVSAAVSSGPSPDGSLRSSGYLLLRRTTTEVAPSQEAAKITLRISDAKDKEQSEPTQESQPAFHWKETSETTLTLYGNQGEPLLAYNFGAITNPDVPANDPRRTRSCYIHPVWGLHGEIMTDDFPRDHYHHHGIFWTWPHVVIREEEFSLWEDKGKLRQRFQKWLCRECNPGSAVLGVENAWMIDDECLLTERVWVTVYPSDSMGRFIDIDLFLLPHVPVTLWGAEGKSYGGLTMRFRPRSPKDSMITVPDGLTKDDLYETRLPWADFTSRFGSDESLSGGTIMVAPNHPDFPPTWLTRHYGPLCIGWPGIQSRTLEPGSCTRLSYRVWIHSDLPSAAEIQRLYDGYAAGFQASCKISESAPK